MTKKHALKQHINSVAKTLADAKAVKGTLCLNNGKPNGGTWKTPALDIALTSKSGFKGGETGQRFYMKFPVYRPRGAEAPGVDDDINVVWKQHVTPMAPSDQLAFAPGSTRAQSLRRTGADRGALQLAGSSTLEPAKRFCEDVEAEIAS